jgi:isoamylase
MSTASLPAGLARKPTTPESVFQGHPLIVTRGHPLPLGASHTPGGVNFVLLCRNGTAVTLVLSEPCNAESATEILLDPRHHRTGDHWHIRIAGLPDEFCYGYRVDGPRGVGDRFDPRVVLVDPAARALSCGRFWGAPGNLPRRSLVNVSMVDDPDDVNPCIPREDSILYELHVRGFTFDPSARVRHPGTFAGLIEKIPYLRALGVTAVELLPIDEFDENDCPFVNPLTGERLKNYWGYNTIAYGAPKAAYASNPERSAPWEEFRRMVRAFHAAGI